MSIRHTLVGAAALAVVTLSAQPLWAQASNGQGVRAGAAKVDITPAPGELPKNYEGVHDRIHSRAIVVENGTTGAVLITVDVGGLSDDTWRNV